MKESLEKAQKKHKKDPNKNRFATRDAKDFEDVKNLDKEVK